MKERPILFSAPMVRALLADTKTVTRRLVTSEHVDDAEVWSQTADADGRWESGIGSDAPGSYGHGEYVRCPYGAAGDRLWVREAFTWITGNGIRPWYRADGEPVGHDGKVLATEPGLRRWSPSIHMPRKVSRIALEVTSVRIERLHDITEEDARAEGVDISEPWQMLVNGEPGKVMFFNHRDAFAHLWQHLNEKRAPWKANPWVWRVEFKRIGAAT